MAWSIVGKNQLIRNFGWAPQRDLTEEASAERGFFAVCPSVPAAVSSAVGRG